MKRIFILISLFLFISHLSFSQEADINLDDIELFPSAGSEIEDGRIVLYNTGQPFITYNVVLRFKRKTLSAPPNLYGTIYYQYINVIDEFQYKQAPFDVNSLYSPLDEKTIYIPSNAPKLDSIRAQGWAIYIPYSPHQFSKKGLKVKIVDVANFNGPSQICNEDIYTIERAGAITLQNASGIATITALGNNQWKVSRIGSASGKIILRSTSNGKTFDKDIEIGTVTKGSISGNAVLQLGESQTYTLALNGNTDYNWSVTYNPNVTWTKLSATSIKLSTTGSVPMGWSENITISAQAVGSCGTSSNYISKTIKFVNERDPRLD